MHATGPQHLSVIDDALIEVDDAGVIVDVRSLGPADGDEVACDVRLKPGTMLMPGFVDTHLHAPQWPQLGSGLDLPLERWLHELTFPLEARFADVDLAATVYNDMVPELLSLGATSVVYHSSVHREATLVLADACVRHGQRALVGRVAMDHSDATPEWYRDRDAASAVASSAGSIDDIMALGSSRVAPIITPRFIPACTDETLAGLGRLAAETDVIVQTHCSESDWQHGAVFERFGVTDTMALDGFGLLRDHTVLAHATHLSADDADRIIEVGSGVAHCPMSNSYFANAVFPARRHIAAGMRVGLGTDVAGGPSPSIAEQVAHAVTVSRMLNDGVDPGGASGRDAASISMTTAFWMATLGGADLAGLPVGVFERGRHFDAIVVDEPTATSGVDGLTAEVRLERIIRSLVRSRPRRVWVDGVDVTPHR